MPVAWCLLGTDCRVAALLAMTPFDAVRNLRAAGGVGPYGLMPDAYCLMPVASPQ